MSRIAAGLLVALAVLAGAAPLRAQTESAFVSILNPRTGSNVGQGTIEVATVLVRPKGVHAEVSLYLTYSARAANVADSDTLEIVHTFTLPKEASVVDSWLWMEDDTTIVRAKMLDLWTATQIYETIVRRVRRDPSILYKRSATAYELRVYPTKRPQRRRVKLTYLVPYRTGPDGVDVPLPTAMLTSSRFPLVPTVLAWPESPDAMPVFVEDASRPFRWNTDAVRGTYAYSAIPSGARARLHVRFPRPWPREASMQVYPEGNGGWYALTLPFTPSPRGRKLVVALNLASVNFVTLPTPAQERARVLAGVQKALQSSLLPSDSLLVLASRDQASFDVSGGWIPADTASIRRAFDAIGTMSDSTRLSTLLPTAVARAKTRPGAAIVLVNASDAEATFERANPILSALPATLPRIEIYDASSNNKVVTQGGRTWRGNEYLDNILSQRGGGFKLFYAYHGVIEGMMRPRIASAAPLLSGYDIAVANTNGVAYARTALTSEAYLDRPYTQVGRYVGSSPTSVRFAGILGEETIARTFTVVPTVVDSTVRTLWWAQELRRLEDLPPDNAVVSQMIAASTRENVLTKQTALLALDPSLGGVVCLSCVDEGANPPVSAERGERAEAASLRASPNPFRGTLSVRVTLALPTSTDDLRAEVYDMLGRRVRTLRIDESGVVSQFTLTWDAQTDAGTRAAAGAYVVVITTPQGRLSQVVTLLD